MPHLNQSAAAAIVAASPNCSDGSPVDRRAAEPVNDMVKVHCRGRLASLLSMMSCRSNSSISSSIHFHAQKVEDSVHVIIKHDRESCKRQGQPEKAYTPRAPLSEILVAAHKEEALRRQTSASPKRIEAREEDGESEVDRDILAALSTADCVCGSAMTGR